MTSMIWELNRFLFVVGYAVRKAKLEALPGTQAHRGEPGARLRLTLPGRRLDGLRGNLGARLPDPCREGLWFHQLFYRTE